MPADEAVMGFFFADASGCGDEPLSELDDESSLYRLGLFK